MSSVRRVPWTVWLWAGLLALTWLLVALPGEPTFAPSSWWGIAWLVFDAILVVGVIRRSHLAWSVAAVVTVVMAVSTVSLALPFNAMMGVLIALSAGQVAALFLRQTRDWTPGPAASAVC